MSKHTPQWRLDIAMMVETLEASRTYIDAHRDESNYTDYTLRALELAIKLGKQYQQEGKL